jgi:hypothetical protein
MLPNPGSAAMDVTAACDLVEQRELPGCVNDHSDMGAVERQVPEVIIFRDRFD